MRQQQCLATLRKGSNMTISEQLTSASRVEQEGFLDLTSVILQARALTLKAYLTASSLEWDLAAKAEEGREEAAKARI